MKKFPEFYVAYSGKYSCRLDMLLRLNKHEENRNKFHNALINIQITFNSSSQVTSYLSTS